MQDKKQAVYGIVFNEDRTEVLLVQRRDVPVWVLPGGGLNSNESKELGALREVEEETGFRVQLVRQVAEYLPVNKLTELSFLFEFRLTGGQEKLGPETRAVRFFPLHSLPPLLPPPFEGWIRDAKDPHANVIRKKIEGVSYWVLCKHFFLHPLLVGRYLLAKLGLPYNT